MAQRLAKMERLISDFALGPSSADEGTSPSISESSQPEESCKEKANKKSLPVVLSSDTAESGTDFSWAIPDPNLASHTACPENGVDAQFVRDVEDGQYKGKPFNHLSESNKAF